MRKEVERKIEAIPKIYCEPQLISDHDIRNEQEEMALPYYCRFKAVDDVKLLGKVIIISYIYSRTSINRTNCC